MKGRVCLITGANTGIGKETALALARQGAKMVLAGRSKERTQKVLDEINNHGGEKAMFIPLDLGSLDSVREGAAAFLESGLDLDVLINNAGLAGHRGITADDFEITFGVNHLAVDHVADSDCGGHRISRREREDLIYRSLLK